MKILIDMNLSPDWCRAFSSQGIESVHWSNIGDKSAPDNILMDWARSNGYIVFTHDLDFGTILAATATTAPSVIQVRTQDTFPDRLLTKIVDALKQFETQLIAGALVTIDENRSRVRILPIGNR
jgi:predicted nuclease of predicted toxin-antitoxin system